MDVRRLWKKETETLYTCGPFAINRNDDGWEIETDKGDLSVQAQNLTEARIWIKANWRQLAYTGEICAS